MEELIPIKEKDGKQAVSARELHSFLGVKRDFSTWIKDRIDKYDLVENQDYEVFTNFGENPYGGRPLVEYALTIDAAKELSMVEGNEKGKIARRYFIEVEKKYRNSFMLPRTYAEALRQLAKQVEDNERQKQIIEEQKPKALFADAVATSTQSCLIGELAKILRQNGVEIGQNRLFDWLRKNGYLCQYGEKYNQPTQRAMEMELFEVKKTSISKPDGTILVTTTTKVTGKGQIYFVNKFLKPVTA